jgi:hypothetical protein
MADHGAIADLSGPTRARRWPRRVAVALAVVLALTVALRAALPFGIARGAEWAAPRYLGLPVRIENVDLGLLRAQLTIEGLSLGSTPEAVLEPVVVAPPAAAAQEPPPAEEAAPSVEIASPTPTPSASRDLLLGWQRVYADLDWRPLLDRTVRIRELVIESPRVRVERGADGRIDPLARAKPTRAGAEPGAESEAPPAPETEPEGAEPPAPWTIALGRLGLRDPEVRIADAERGVDLVELALEEFGLEDLEVKGEDVSLGGVRIEAPRLRMRRDFVFSPASERAPEPEPQGARRALPPYRARQISIERAQFTLLTDRGPLDLAIALDARDATLAEGERFPLRLTLEIEDGQLSLEGQVGVLPPSYHGKLVWKELPFPPLMLAAQPELASWFRSFHYAGEIEVEAQLAATAGASPGIRLRGKTSATAVHVADPKDAEVKLAWKSLDVVVAELDVPLPEPGKPPRPILAKLDQVTLVDPDVRYTLPANALDALLGAPEPAAGEPPAGPATPPSAPDAQPGGESAGPPLDVTIGAFTLSGGSLRFEDRRAARPRSTAVDALRVELGDVALAAAGGSTAIRVGTLEFGSKAVDFEDHTVEPPFRGRLRDLAGRAQALRFPEREARSLRVTGLSADGGRFQLEGSLAGDTGDATFELRRLALRPLNPYAQSAAGYQLGGDATLKTRVELRGARTTTRNDVVLHKLDVKSRDPGDFERRFGVPLDVALALLRDPAGNISLSVPVTVDEKGASTGVGAIVAGALRQALVGALTSPFKMLGAVASGVGGLVGGDGGIAPLASEPGEEALADGQRERIEQLGELLAERPQLALRLRGRAGEADRPGLALRMLTERVQAGDGLPELDEGAGFLARRRITGALGRQARGEADELDPEDQSLLDRYVAAVEVPPERFEALARVRAEHARELAVAEHGLDADRLVLGEPAEPGDPGVVVELTAH